VINKDSLSKIFSITTLIILVAAGLMIRRYGGWGGWFVEALADTGLCLMTVATLFFLEITDVRCRLGASRIISLIARFSFSLYAVHLPVVVLLLCAIPWLANKHDVEWGNHLLYLILLTFVLLISFLCYLVTERNTAKIRACARRWITGQSAHRPVTAGE
jgi:peptidoglycan/LPS O-acetylase OafA/YrhL